jgi:hypothetical protein
MRNILISIFLILVSFSPVNKEDSILNFLRAKKKQRRENIPAYIIPDADAATLISLNSITDEDVQNDIHTFYAKLKYDGVYDKIIALYVTNNNDATKDKWNLVNLVDSDNAHRATFHNSLWHQNDRIRPISNSYINMHLSTDDLDITDITIGAYMLENALPYIGDKGYALGATDGVNELSLAFNNFGYVKASLGSRDSVAKIYKPYGLYLATRNGDNMKVFVNKTKIIDVVATSNNKPSLNIYGLGYNYNDQYSVSTTTPSNLHFVATGFTDADVNNFNDAVSILFQHKDITIPTNVAYFFGNSITQFNTGNVRWTYIICPLRGWTVKPDPPGFNFWEYNYALDGATAPHNWERTRWRTNLYDSERDEVIFLAVGANDCNLVADPNYEQFKTSTENIINYWISLNWPLNKIKVLSIWYLTYFGMYGSYEKATAMNAWLEGFCQTKGVQYLDVWTYGETNNIIAPDGVHPTTEQATQYVNGYINPNLVFE